MTYSMTCTCGQVMSVDAENKDEAVSKMKAMMGPDQLAAHFTDKHAGQPVPSKEQSDSIVEQMVKEG